jgi:hypothetical protein
MAPGVRTWIASFLAIGGSLAVYYGSFLNVVALGGTLGYASIVPGIFLLGLAPLPVRALPPNPRRSILVGILRYLSLPVFLLGAFFILVAGVPMLISGSRVEGLLFGTLITLAGLFAIIWPEALLRLRRTPLISHHGS